MNTSPLPNANEIPPLGTPLDRIVIWRLPSHQDIDRASRVHPTPDQGRSRLIKLDQQKFSFVPSNVPSPFNRLAQLRENFLRPTEAAQVMQHELRCRPPEAAQVLRTPARRKSDYENMSYGH